MKNWRLKSLCILPAQSHFGAYEAFETVLHKRTPVYLI